MLTFLFIYLFIFILEVYLSRWLPGGLSNHRTIGANCSYGDVMSSSSPRRLSLGPSLTTTKMECLCFTALWLGAITLPHFPLVKCRSDPSSNHVDWTSLNQCWRSEGSGGGGGGGAGSMTYRFFKPQSEFPISPRRSKMFLKQLQVVVPTNQQRAHSLTNQLSEDCHQLT